MTLMEILEAAFGEKEANEFFFKCMDAGTEPEEVVLESLKLVAKQQSLKDYFPVK